MYGSLIGLVPKHFIIVLIENHYWYEHNRTTEGGQIGKAYETARRRASNFDPQFDAEAVTPVLVNPSGDVMEQEEYQSSRDELNKSIQQSNGEDVPILKNLGKVRV